MNNCRAFIVREKYVNSNDVETLMMCHVFVVYNTLLILVMSQMVFFITAYNVNVT